MEKHFAKDSELPVCEICMGNFIPCCPEDICCRLECYMILLHNNPNAIPTATTLTVYRKRKDAR